MVRFGLFLDKIVLSLNDCTDVMVLVPNKFAVAGRLTDNDGQGAKCCRKKAEANASPE